MKWFDFTFASENEVNFEVADIKMSATLQPEGSLSSQLRIWLFEIYLLFIDYGKLI